MVPRLAENPDCREMVAGTPLKRASRSSSSWWMLIVPAMVRTAPGPAPKRSRASRAASTSRGWSARPR
jgi:hypothetical protein